MGPISIGKNAVISEATVIDIDTAMGDGTQLGHASSCTPGQTVPDGQHWHGSPGRQTLRTISSRSIPHHAAPFGGSPTRPISCCPCCWCGCR